MVTQHVNKLLLLDRQKERTVDILQLTNKRKLSQKQFTIQMLREKKENYILLRLEQPTSANGLVDSEMVTESRCGLMVLVMKVTGKIIERMVKENLFI